MICLVLILMVLAVFWQCRGFAFVNFDDNSFVYGNQHVLRGLTWQNAGWSLTAGIGKDATDADFWRPLSFMSHMLDVSLFGLNAGAHHLMSVALHAVTAVALFLVLRAMTGTMWRSVFVAAVFAVHPLHVESVAWVAERKDVLSGLFFVLALAAYTRFARRPFRWGNYLLVLLAAALGLLSKPMLVTLPCVLLLLDHWPLKRTGVVPARLLLMEKAPLFLMSALVAALTLSGHGSANDEKWALLPWYVRFGNAMLSYATYLLQTVWPSELACFYPFSGMDIAVGQVVASMLVLAVITFVAVRYRQRRFLVVGWLWYLGILVPVIGFTQAGDQAHADRYTYLSMIGITVMAAWAVAEWAGERPFRRRLAGVVAIAILAALMAAAHNQTAYWRDSRTLWAHAVECTPSNAVALANLGSSQIELGQTEAALASYRRALAIQPDYKMARLNLGIVLVQTGKHDEAVPHLRRMLADDPRSAEAHSTLALALVQQGDLEQAAGHFQSAAEIRPDAGNFCNLGNVQLRAGQVRSALASYQRASEADPDHAEAHFYQGMIHAGMGEFKAAGESYEKAVARNPAHLPSINNLAWLLATSKDDSLRNGSRAVELMERAVNLPGGSMIHLLRTLAAAHAEAGHYDRAGQIVQQAAVMARSQGDEVLARQLQVERNTYISGAPWRE